MNTRLNLSTQDESVKLLQITDTHLFSDTEDHLLGVPTFKSFQSVINSIKQQQIKYDLIVCTGDVTQDQSVESYQHFINEIETFETPVVWLPGNHDHQIHMKSAMDTTYISCAKQILINDDWQCVLLDSQIHGVPKGELSTAQLSFLDNSLSDHKDKNTIIFIHHNPLPCGSKWLDQHKLQNSNLLSDIVYKHDNIKAIVCGHIHQEIDSSWCDVPFYATPSTSIQFLPHSEVFSLDTVSPGWREFTLNKNGSFSTHINRIKHIDYLVDVSAKGY